MQSSRSASECATPADTATNGPVTPRAGARESRSVPLQCTLPSPRRARTCAAPALTATKGAASSSPELLPQPCPWCTLRPFSLARLFPQSRRRPFGVTAAENDPPALIVTHVPAFSHLLRVAVLLAVADWRHHMRRASSTWCPTCSSSEQREVRSPSPSLTKFAFASQ